MKNGPFEDVFPIENGDIPATYVSLPECRTPENQHRSLKMVASISEIFDSGSTFRFYDRFQGCSGKLMAMENVPFEDVFSVPILSFHCYVRLLQYMLYIYLRVFLFAQHSVQAFNSNCPRSSVATSN